MVNLFKHYICEIKSIIMKSIAKLIFIALAIMLPAVSFGQKDVTKFLGIPVDGTKSEMIRKLKAKGFKLVNDPYSDDEHLEGVFNGEKVNISIITNGEKVWRIYIGDRTLRDVIDIKIRFNKLVRQFAFNDKYSCASESYVDYIIPDDEDISYNMLVSNKRYEASFIQNPTDSIEYEHEMGKIFSNFSEEEIEYQPDEIKEEIYYKFFEYLSKRSVWFIISEHAGQYFISMYYDNGYNQANGEDL